MQLRKSLKSSAITALMLLVIVPLSACAAGKVNTTYPPSATETSITITFSPQGGVSLTDSNGRPLTPCALACTAETKEKYGKRCPEVNPELPVCKGLTDATVTDITTLTIIESVKNPYCYTSCFNYNCSQICY